MSEFFYVSSNCLPTHDTAITAGMGLLMAAENGWEIHWSLFKLLNHLSRETIVYK